MAMMLSALMVCAQIAQDPAPSAPAAQKPSAVEAPAVAAINGFGLDLYKVLAAREPKQNLFFSPLSITTALTMVAEGARGETAAEMTKVLHLPTPLLPAHEGFAVLWKSLIARCGTLPPEQRSRLASKVRALAMLRRDPMGEGTPADESEGPRMQDELAIEAVNEALAANRDLLGSFEFLDGTALWLDKGMQIAPAFTSGLQRWYGTGRLNLLDLLHDPDGSLSHINAWVEHQTGGRIRNFLQGRDALATGLVLTHALYFRGAWQTPFECSGTSLEDFTLANGEVVQVRQMHRTGDGMRYGAFHGDGGFFCTPSSIAKDTVTQEPMYPEEDGFLIAQLPFEGGLAMTLIVPRSPSGLPRIEQMLDTETLAAWLEHIHARKVDVGIPRLRMEASALWKEPIRQLGVQRAFRSPASQDGAQFGGMVDPPGGVWVGEIHAKARLSLDEEGSDAVARSPEKVRSGWGVRWNSRPFIPVFRADRPFLFLIRDTASGAILFVGRVVDPRTGD